MENTFKRHVDDGHRLPQRQHFLRDDHGADLELVREQKCACHVALVGATDRCDHRDARVSGDRRGRDHHGAIRAWKQDDCAFGGSTGGYELVPKSGPSWV
ncbi:MAG: hypothetical protein ACKV2T_01105 [Kofleriaceae bacterium]